MPKPIYGINGSGMHTNMSLTKDGRNAFTIKTTKRAEQIAYSFIAGILEHIKGMVAVTNPLVNSYKRLVPGYEAPVYIAWSAHNRSPLIRVPASGGESTRIELRCPDPSANPYLALAVCLMAGLDGIKRNLTACEGVDENIFSMSEEQRASIGIESLPGTLEEAIAELEKDSLVREALGDHIFSYYVHAKKKEWDDYRVRVNQWEIDNYLDRY